MGPPPQLDAGQSQPTPSSVLSAIPISSPFFETLDSLPIINSSVIIFTFTDASFCSKGT